MPAWWVSNSNQTAQRRHPSLKRDTFRDRSPDFGDQRRPFLYTYYEKQRSRNAPILFDCSLYQCLTNQNPWSSQRGCIGAPHLSEEAPANGGTSFRARSRPPDNQSLIRCTETERSLVSNRDNKTKLAKAVGRES